jgi:hypothetical protein
MRTAFMLNQTMQQVGNDYIDLFWYFPVAGSEQTGSKQFNELRRKAGHGLRRLIDQLSQRKLNAPVLTHPRIPADGGYYPPNLVFSRRVMLDRLADRGEGALVEKVLKATGFTYKPMQMESSLVERVAGRVLVAYNVKDMFEFYGPKKLEMESKDRKRFDDILDKAMKSVVGPRGRLMERDYAAFNAKVEALVRQMAKSITQPDKAWRRGLAAEDENYHDMAAIFFKRAEELWLHRRVSSELVCVARFIEAKEPKGPLANAVRAFEAARSKYSDFGATDTEPREWFHERLEKAINNPGTEVSIGGDNPWSLYSSMSGSKAANRALTNAFRRVEAALERASFGEVRDLANWYGLRVNF